MYPSNKRTYEEIERRLNDLGYKLLSERMEKNRRMVVIQDETGYKYDVQLYNVINEKNGISFVDKRNPYTLLNISLWLLLNDKDFQLCEDSKYTYAKEKLKFYHPFCDEYFYVAWAQIQSGQNCAVCAGQQVGEKTSFGYLEPELTKEYIYSENNKSPYEIPRFSTENVYWECHICGYKWWMQASARSMGKGCSACVGKVVTDLNRLSIRFPNIAQEWHPLKNGNMNPDNVSYGSNKKAWWICKDCGHEWKSVISNRTHQQGCPRCIDEKKESHVATECKQYSYDNYNAEPEYKLFKNPTTNQWLRCDIYIPNNIYIEIHGPQHYTYSKYFFKDQEEFEYRQHLDKVKKEFCQENGLYIEIDIRKIKTPEDAISHIENILKGIQ